MNLNTSLVALNNQEFDTLINEALTSLSSEIENLSLSVTTKSDIIRIARICTQFGIINQPRISATFERESNPRKRLTLYTARWLKKLVSNRNRSFTLKEALPLSERDIVRDPALSRVLERYYVENNITVTPDEINLAINSHDLLMSIENIQGHLLEEYIARNICKPPFNFIWLEGEIVKAADFALYIPSRDDKTDDTLYLLQIKNKYNTENSSSVTVRIGTTVEIAKWYRLGKKKQQGVNVPVYKWSNLNAIIQDFTGHSPNLSEIGYFAFLDSVIKTNPKLINI